MVSIEQHSFKITIGIAVTFIIAIILSVLQVSAEKASIEQDITSLQTSLQHQIIDLEKYDRRLIILESENTEIKVRLATIETKLDNIAELLLEIKQDMKISN